MNRKYIILSLILCIAMSFGASYAQDSGVGRSQTPTIAPRPTPPKLSSILAANLNKLPKHFESSRENRQSAYAKLLEGQRHIWNIRRTRSSGAIRRRAILARSALREAVELDPNLAEAYTALAELSLTTPPQDINEAILLSKIATKLDKDNFGAQKFLGRLFTIKSNLSRGKLNDYSANQAISAWKEITRLDPRNAEAWAFLSAFYKETGQIKERIDSLRKWMSSSSPLEVGFYSRVFVQNGGLTSENATIKLGEALIEVGDNKEALTILTRAVSESPRSLEAVELLSHALENVEGKSLKPAIDALRQAVFSSPDNISLNQLLAQTIAKGGDIDGAAKFLETATSKFLEKDKAAASSFQVSLGDIFAEAKRTDEAIKSYKKSFEIRGIGDSELGIGDERDFAYLVINKMLTAYKKVNRFDDARAVIELYRPLFGKDDLSLDREVISLLQESGKNKEALNVIRSIRKKSPDDYDLLQKEASLLVDLGKVEQGVNLIQNLIDNKPTGVSPSIMYDDFINYLFISSLYMQSSQNLKAVDTAQKAILAARGKENKQIARLRLASAHQSAKDFDKSEEILQAILKESPTNPIALNNLGYLFLESGKKYGEALELINKAIEIDPRNPSYLDSLGWAYFKLGKLDRAERHLEKAAQYNSSSAVILEHLGDVYKKKGKAKKAKETWTKALNFTGNAGAKKRIKAKLAR